MHVLYIGKVGEINCSFNHDIVGSTKLNVIVTVCSSESLNLRVCGPFTKPLETSGNHQQTGWQKEIYDKI